MRFLVITLAPALQKGDELHSYAPYVREMDMWFDSVDQVVLLCPTKYNKDLLTAPFKRNDIEVLSIPFLEFGSVLKAIKSLMAIPIILFLMYRQMALADHIHVRAPGNIALLAAFVQIFYPSKKKTAKYAGNWDPKSKQPLSYRLQKWLLSNTTLTKNMQILVYGNWPYQTKNVKPFFTATYRKNDALAVHREFNVPYKFVFVGSIVTGKRPMYVVQLIEKLINKGMLCHLDMYGEGDERAIIETYIEERNLKTYITLHGNTHSDTVKQAYQNSHFLMLPSKSEGWPKVVAEAMFWGCIPIVTPISCVPWMLNNESRGILISMDLDEDVQKIVILLEDKTILEEMGQQGMEWSRQYTLDDFEFQIAELL